MPAVQPPAVVLVTGASGFIAAWIIQRLLEARFNVVGTVRSHDKGKFLQELYKGFGDKFTYAIIEDIAKNGAFDEAVKNVDVVVHTASPIHFSAKSPDEYNVPAIRGTVGVLESVANNGAKVKRVIITSSVSSVLHPAPDGYAYTEDDWNDHDVKQVEEKGDKASPVSMYNASKVLAERAAWKFIEGNKDKIAFDLVTIMPSFVLGPTIHQVKDASSLNTSISLFRKYIIANALPAPPSKESLLTSPGGYVDVRDVAEAHVQSILRDQAGDQRFITSAGSFHWQEFLNHLIGTPLEDAVNKGYPSEPSLTPNPPYSNGEKATKILGIQYIDKKQVAHDTTSSLIQRFPVQATKPAESSTRTGESS
ncbi:D-lactaldehyde dehydrogenase [Cantharellus anzutake]|uniref:D-lactaldehyde dehydrogenase n=1 Tax=Cantharellus anzutake TaxID=1750568 RepID=UPI00190818C0|nr:D-lactaldehyde dehydrogenase [Cantharellus anzutake]KAF8342995.1 D-lactaldehyde dehydrogenase [Cantharellus anzutake]